MQPILSSGTWTDSRTSTAAAKPIQAVDPNTGQPLDETFPVSDWADLEPMAVAAGEAFQVCRDWPGERFAAFLEAAADEVEANADAIAEAAQRETGLGYEPRLRIGEMNRTIGQLRQAADAARTSSWRLPTIDTAAGVRSMHISLGPVFVIGPNNFPLAFNAISGGDFCGAVAAGCPVIAKAHPSHPLTSQRIGEAMQRAAEKTDMPPGFVQMFYHCTPEDGIKLIQHPAVASVAFTGSRSAGMKIKATADSCGKPAYLEMSSLNPVVVLPEAAKSRTGDIAEQFAGSCLMGGGQFCTNPGLVILPKESDALVLAMAERFAAAPCPTMLSGGTREHYERGLQVLADTGAEQVAQAEAADDDRISVRPTLFKIDAATFVKHAGLFQTEVFGPCSLLVVADDVAQMQHVLRQLDGQLTGCLYADAADADAYATLEPALRRKVGRLLNDQMPTGVAVSAAMNHGGPYPATGHPGFTAVGLPASARRFSLLASYDNVADDRLPPELRNANPNRIWRFVDGKWTAGDVA